MTMLLLLALAATQADAPPVLQRMLDCRAIQDRDARLACFDREAGTVAAAQQSREIVVLDREQARESERAVTAERRRVEAFTGTIRGARFQSPGRWLITLEDGSRWLQTDSTRVVRGPEAGMQIAIRPAALGSYFANIAGQRAIRVRAITD